MDFIMNCFWDSFRTEFVAKFLAAKVKTKISGLSVWPGMAILCEIFLCVIAGNLITC